MVNDIYGGTYLLLLKFIEIVYACVCTYMLILSAPENLGQKYLLQIIRFQSYLTTIEMNDVNHFMLNIISKRIMLGKIVFGILGNRFVRTDIYSFFVHADKINYFTCTYR